MKNSIALFERNRIRRIYDEESETWYFSVIDVIAALTESDNPRDYWFKMKIRVKSDDGLELSTICRQFKLEAQDGKMRATDTANVQGLLRIIQSIPSPKAEPFKQWLARVGYERMQEIADPERSMNWLAPPKMNILKLINCFKCRAATVQSVFHVRIYPVWSQRLAFSISLTS
ncbi:MAG: Bro-N domain-containing protein [Acidobacteria bacterium]|nr:Bro-N domain-containing protein [Acidobacteriota bacterium]